MVNIVYIYTLLYTKIFNKRTIYPLRVSCSGVILLNFGDLI